ncbi:MAG TPA: DUF2911 domain-containing protein [Gemmatimonadaceae bacterium]|nr:DUF2911 domain-containing protein [Gemmatimonadaceae bacterium]
MTSTACRIALLLALVACGTQHEERYGFVATLGSDTTSVEQVTRTPSRIVVDAVGRSPRVTRRHWTAQLGPDGSVQKWSMDTYIPNAEPANQHIHHTADFSGNTISLSRGVAAGSRDFAYQKQYPATVPWNAFVYSTYEPLFDAARRQGAAARIGQYFFEGWDESHIGYADIRRQSDGSYSLASTGLAGSGVAHFDSAGRMVAYSGAGTTYKQEVRRVSEVPNIDSLTTRLAAAELETGVPSELSPGDFVQDTLGSAILTITYSRPARRGRTLVGGLIPYDQVWRTGANAATQFTTSEPITLAGIPLHAGKYTLWTLPSKTGVQLIVNGQTGQWGTSYRSSADVARKPMQVDSLPGNVEQFTIRVEPDAAAKAGAGRGRLVMEWGQFRWSAAIQAPVPAPAKTR